jgi:hypothetical protein
LPFKKPEGSLPCSQEPFASAYSIITPNNIGNGSPTQIMLRDPYEYAQLSELQQLKVWKYTEKT